ncbi:MAG: alpha/beta hydrolase [Lysobacterales bacterium]
MSRAHGWHRQVGDFVWAGLQHDGGDGQPPVLALHGWLDNAASFAPLMASLPQRQWCAPDLPGHGESAHRPSGSWYHFIDNVSDLLALLDAMAWPQVDLVGHSMGGAIATLLAAAAPERVRSLVLLEALGPLARQDDAGFVQDLRRGMADRLRVSDKQPRVHASIASARRARQAATPMSDHATDLLLDRALQAVEGGFTWRTDPRLTLATPVRASETQILAMLAVIECPTLIVLADPATPYLDGEVAERRLEALRPAQVLRLPGGHHLHLDDAEPVAAAMAPFWASLAAPT